MKIEFILNRILRMSPPEIVYRLYQKFQTKIEKTMRSSYNFNTGTISEANKLFESSAAFKDFVSLLIKADKSCEDYFDLFALKAYKIEGKLNYHKDYKSGKAAPSDIFGKSIDYRDSKRIGDIKYIWEINRHLFLLPLALAFKLTNKQKYLEKLKYFISEWIAQNPFLLGVNWTSSLELGIRLINWTICWHLIGDKLDSEFKKIWLDSFYRHCWFINRNLSSFSSANNHLIGEAAGLFIASTAMPQFKASKKWTECAYKILIREGEKQNYQDGVNKEQAISYQQFVLDFLILSGLIGEVNDIEFPSGYWHTVEKMLVYLAAIEDAKGNLPQIGDEDDGFVLDVMQKETGIYTSLLNTGAYLFKKDELLRKKGNLDSKTMLLLSIKNIQMEDVKFTKSELPNSFENGGYYILGTDFHTALEQKLIFDCGNLGYLSLAAHGHADALSITFYAGGVPIFIDPGTYAYHADKKWRSYFRSTLAHNTVRIDNRDQSLMSGNFMWSSKAKAKIIKHQEFLMAKGFHDGYKSLKDSVIHQREVSYIKDLSEWKIEDDFICKGRHSIELLFHTHPDCRVLGVENEIRIYFDGGYCIFEMENDIEFKLYKGNEEIPLGWYSPSYDVKVPTTAIKLFREINGSTKIETKFRIMFDRQ